MKSILISVFALIASIPTLAQALTVEYRVTPEYIKQNPGVFAIKVEKRDDGMLKYTVTKSLARPQYVVGNLYVRHGGQRVIECHFGAEVRQDAVQYYFVLAPQYLADSVLSISEHAFSMEGGRAIAFVGGVDYTVRLSDYAPQK